MRRSGCSLLAFSLALALLCPPLGSIAAAGGFVDRDELDGGGVEDPPILADQDEVTGVSAGSGAGEPPACEPPSGCCKICDAGKACGDSCISESFTCHVGDGCACDIENVCG